MKSEKLPGSMKRIINLDVARTFAITTVVLCHAVELIYSMNLDGWLQASRLTKIFRTVAFTTGRLGVPIFLFLTGYLLLSRTYKSERDVKKFYKKNLLPIVLTTEIWIIIYNIFMSIYNNTNFSIILLVKQMLFLEKVNLMNTWYMPMIIGIYIVIPYLSNILHSFPLKTLKLPLFLVFIICFIMPTVNLILEVYGLELYSSILNISFLGGTYGLYIIVGYGLIHNKKLRNISTFSVIVLSIISFGLACAVQLFRYIRYMPYNIWYDSPFIFICSLFLFELFMRIKTEKLPNVVNTFFTYISKISLSIYFIHIIVEMLLQPYIQRLAISNFIKLFILFSISFIITILISWSTSKIKLVKNKVLLIK